MDKITKIFNKLYIDKIFIKYVIIGIINTIIGAAIMFGFYNIFGLGYWISSVSNYILTSILSYYLNCRYTFNRSKNSIKSICRFTINIIVCYALSHIIAKQAVGLMRTGISYAAKDHISMLSGMILFAIFNYIGQRMFVFKNNF